MLRFVDLFSGVGGMTLGFNSARQKGRAVFQPELLVDANGPAIDTFRRNQPSTRAIVARVENTGLEHLVELGVCRGPRELDVLIGGPPCQGFSILRKNKHLDDDRNLCIREFLRVVGEVQPKAVLMENVKNLLHCGGGAFAREIKEAFATAGYSCDAQILSAEEFGVPQIRERAFFLAYRKDVAPSKIRFPKPLFASIRTAKALHDKNSELRPLAGSYVSVEEAIDDLPSLAPGGKATAYTKPVRSGYQASRRKNCRVLHNHEARLHSQTFLNKIGRIEPGSSNKDLDRGERFDSEREKEYFSQAYGRLHADGIAYTITTHFQNPGSGRFIHYRDLRSLTVREAARFQSFDDDFAFYGTLAEQQEQVGNAVPPLLARALAEQIASVLLDSEPQEDEELLPRVSLRTLLG